MDLSPIFFKTGGWFIGLGVVIVVLIKDWFVVVVRVTPSGEEAISCIGVVVVMPGVLAALQEIVTAERAIAIMVNLCKRCFTKWDNHANEFALPEPDNLKLLFPSYKASL